MWGWYCTEGDGTCDGNTGRVQMTERRFSTSPPAAPGSHELPERAHRPALSRHRLSAFRGLLGQNLHLHSGQCPFCPLEGASTPPWLRRGEAAASLNTFWAPRKSDPGPLALAGDRRPPPGWNLCGLFPLQRPHRCAAALLLERKGPAREEKAVGLSCLRERVPGRRASTPPQGRSRPEPVRGWDLSSFFIPLRL